MQDITARIDALCDLLNDLMLFARPRPLRAAPLQLRGLVEEAVTFLRRDESLRAIEVTVEGDDTLLKADGELIRATVLNLLLNSAQAMAGQGRIAVRLSRTQDGPAIEIRDSGPGIPPHLRAQVFEPFFTTKARGGGLGLPIAKRTAERHGGTLTLECPPEGGTVATLTLSFSPAAAVSSYQPEMPEP
jgi:signal transduction histidine kinase